MSGEWLWEAPEYFTSSVVAQNIHKNCKSTYVCLEWNIGVTLQDARSAPKRGRPHKSLSGAKRFDLVLFYGSTGRPRAVVEVKHRLINNDITLSKDFDRLRRAVGEVNLGSSLSLGCLVVYLECGVPQRRDACSKDRIERKQRELGDWAKGRLSGGSDGVELKVRLGEVVYDENGAYGAVIVSLFNPKKRVS